MADVQLGEMVLRDYQSQAVESFLNEPGCLVAFDKGGGKTLTALALTEQRLATKAGPVLVISDKVSPWQDTFNEAGLPGERLHCLAETSAAWFKWLLEEPADGHYYVIHWAGIVPWLNVLSGIYWHSVLADEAHHAKNKSAARTLGLKRLRTRFKVGLTADPDDDVPPSLWSLLNWLYPKRYTSYWRWIQLNFEVTEDKNHKTDTKYKVIGKPINVKALREELKPFFVKLSMREIDPDQPADLIEEILVDMHPGQREAYEQMVEWQMMELGDDIVIADYSVVKFTRLQQLAQAMGVAETRLVWRWCTTYDSEGNETRERRQVETVRIRSVEPAPKLDALIDTLRTRDLGPTIVYSQFPDFLELACKRLSDAGLTHIAVKDSSQVTDAKRAFERGDADIIIGTSGVMGESIRLPRADTVIFLDTHYNPRVVGQAIGRGKLVGKRTPLRVIYIRTRNSVDMIRLDKARTKQEWREALLGDRGII